MVAREPAIAPDLSAAPETLASTGFPLMPAVFHPATTSSFRDSQPLTGTPPFLGAHASQPNGIDRREDSEAFFEVSAPCLSEVPVAYKQACLREEGLEFRSSCPIEPSPVLPRQACT